MANMTSAALAKFDQVCMNLIEFESCLLTKELGVCPPAIGSNMSQWVGMPISISHQW
jgi:hypothetical protein